MKNLKNKKLVSVSIVLILTLIGAYSLFAASTSGMRDISAIDLVWDMKAGWNLGNTMDGNPGETSWGNPMTTQAMMDTVKAMGFNAVRIPVSWSGHFGGAPNYTIDAAWLNRVEQIVNYVLNDNMYAIVNTHHDTSWIIPTYAAEATSTDKLTKIWTQIANRFINYSDYLLFEIMNEPRVPGSAAEWSGGTAENRDVINHFDQAGLTAIRNTGGNNALRFVVITTNAATSMDVAINALVIPNDSRVIVSQHTYYPYSFSMDTAGTTTWGTASDKSACDAESDRLYNKFGKNGIAVIIGEWGSINKNNTADRAVHAQYYANSVRNRGMLPVWWDNGGSGNGGFGILNRNANSWSFPTIAQGLVAGAASATKPGGSVTTPTPPAPTTAPGLLGDVNNSGGVDIVDALIVAQFYVGMTPSPFNQANADTNRDGKIDIIDALRIAQYYVGIITQF